MNLSGQITGEQAARFLRNDYDLQVAFPARPCLIPELLILPYRARDIIILGSEKPRLIKASRSREEVMKLLKLLAGTKTTEELTALTPVEERESFYNLQALLFRYGLLQDGPISPPEKGREALSSFVGRYIDKTRFHRNRDESLRELARGRLAVYAPASVADELTFALQSAGLGAYLIVGTNADELTAFDPSFALAICDGGQGADELLQFANERGIPSLWTAIGTDEARMGPLILPQITVGHECVSRQLPAMQFSTDGNDLLFWSAYALQEALLLMAGVTPGAYYNKTIAHHYGAKRQYTTYHNLARIPGLKTSGLAGADPLDVGSPAFLAWKQHCITRLPPKKYLPPKTHQVHYSAQNLSGAQKALASEYGSLIQPLPATWNLSASLPWLDARRSSPAELTASSVGDLLRVAVGHQKVEAGDRRISPSGGGLKSAGFFVRTRSVAGIEDGWYSYNPGAHGLEAIRNLDSDGIAAALPPGLETQPLVIVVVARLQRVRDKYHEFSYNVVHLDAGVATAFATWVADSFGWQVCHQPHVPHSSLAHSLGIDEKDNCRIISNLFSIGVPQRPISLAAADDEEFIDNLVLASRWLDPRSSLPARDPRRPSWRELGQRSGARSFEEVLKSRRAIYDFRPSALPAAVLEDLVRLGQEAKQRLRAEGMLAIPFDIYVLRALGDGELAAGAYETNRGRITTWKCISSAVTAADLNRCLNQNSLAKAPVLFALVANLDETFQHYGAAGYRHLLNQCGFVFAQVWLAAHAAGLVGTLCGGVLDEGIRHLIGSDGYTKAPIFSFVVGEPGNQAKEAGPNDTFDGERVADQAQA